MSSYFILIQPLVTIIIIIVIIIITTMQQTWVPLKTENTKMMRMDKISKSQQKKLQLVFWKENGLACFPKCLKLWGETTSTLK